SPTLVLTAAHCINFPDFPESTFGISFGRDVTTRGDFVELPAKAFPHPNYVLHQVAGESNSNDIGVVELTEPIDSSKVPALALDDKSFLLTGNNYTIVGYGGTPNTLKWGNGVYGGHNSEVVTASVGTFGADPSDSGGPLLTADGKILGVLMTANP